MIPKMIHQYWEGPKNGSNTQQLQSLNPDWEIHQWTPDSIGTLINQEKFDRADLYIVKGREPVYRSNLVRAELLLLFGGIYVDMDWIPLQSFDQLIDRDVVLGNDLGNEADPAVVGSEPWSPFAFAFIHSLGNLDINSYRYAPGCISAREAAKETGITPLPYGVLFAINPTDSTIGHEPPRNHGS